MEELFSTPEGKVWQYFSEILAVPRPSKKEEKIIQYLESFADSMGLERKKDEAGNVLIIKRASPGKEHLKTVVLQSHIDMVCEKNQEVTHDFENDPIQAFIDEEWIKAKGTTLGADNGIGIAAQLALLAADDIEHGPVECLFTVDEETGLTGAFQLAPLFLSGDILLNLDSEDEGQLFIGCAGGIDTVATFKTKVIKPLRKTAALSIKLTGLTGGHSGDEIHKGFGNSLKIMNTFLWELRKNHKIQIADFQGGNLRNAIPREAEILLVVNKKQKESIIEAFEQYVLRMKQEYSETDPGLQMTCTDTDLPKRVLGKKLANKIIDSLYACPHGVMAWSTEMEGLVETSTNLASIKTGGKKIVVTTSQRSSVQKSKIELANAIESIFKLAKASVSHSDGYPGWKPDRNSEILKITEKAYQKLFRKKAQVRAIHAGLECGLFLEKYPALDMVSFGPTIKGPHSPGERLHIPSVGRFWKLLLEVLKNIPPKNALSATQD